ncbi:MAG: hypothetical protein QHH30_11075, partial [candidate division NC10 bacterium]|nr:hypothetical protein [candidate division NC10 bacterium]
MSHSATPAQEAAHSQPSWKIRAGLLGLVYLHLSFFSFAACSSGKSEEPKMTPAVPVTVAHAVQKTIPMQIRSIGTVEAYSTVSVKTQVGGVLTGVY